MRLRWQVFVKENILPYRVTNHAPFVGRGIVVVGDHPKSLKHVRVLVRSLRNLGSVLPVELHHWAGELNAKTKLDLIRELGVNFTINDLFRPHNLYFSKTQYNDISHINFQLKTAAILNTRLAEPLLLDSDNVPANLDPAVLWDSATYQEYGPGNGPRWSAPCCHDHVPRWTRNPSNGSTGTASLSTTPIPAR
ncbi:glycosyltransferase family 71 [Apiospora hydei]|uniref:Glycosyltransferase family 71 n=1 Tax=Apiospora hydei TaxID=1337664 RepID=A0ABR1WXX7_9PEZI